MNDETRSNWLEALRSGDYEQGTTYLQADGRFCCLGVLCELYIKTQPEDARWIEKQYNEYDANDARLFQIGDGFRCEDYPPDEVLNLGFDDSRNLARMNDHGYTFEQIADHIEEKL